MSDKLSSDYETMISLLDVYLVERNHRDQMLWMQMFKLFYAILIIILAPNIAELLNLNLPPIAFRLVGLISSFLFLYISLCSCKRLEASNESCNKIMKKLPSEYHRVTITELKDGKFFKLKLSYFVCFSLFLSLFFLSILLILINV